MEKSKDLEKRKNKKMNIGNKYGKIELKKKEK